MKISDWKIAGQLQSAITEIQTACRELCRLANAGPQILVWLNTERGKEILTTVVNTVIAKWKVEYEREERVNRIKIGPTTFEELIQNCNFEGRLLNIKEENFPSNLTSFGTTIEFEELASYTPIQQGNELALLSSHGLRPAQPREYLAWLEKNQKAGIVTAIHCAIPDAQGNYMYACLCGGGGRGLHLDHPSKNEWPAATVFLGVEIE